MNDKLKPLITLSQINSLPDGHLHSKVSFLKSIINEEQNSQILQMKQKVYKMSYTIKNIGIHGQQIGITSKRIPFKAKQTSTPQEENLIQKQTQIYKLKYLPHNSFYSQALVPIKIQKNNQISYQENKRLNQFTITSSIMKANNYFKQNQANYHLTDTKFAKKMNKSPNQFKISTKFSNGVLKSISKRQGNLKQKEFIEKVTTIQKSKSAPKINNLSKLNHNKKSFSKLLNQYQIGKRYVQMLPLQHEQNSLFKKIKKLQKLTIQKNQNLYQRTKSMRGLSRNTTSFMGRYTEVINTVRNPET